LPRLLFYGFSVFIFIIILLVGLLTFHHYGESWDEKSLQKYAVKSLHAYQTWPDQGIVTLTRDDLGNYGPFYVMFVEELALSLFKFLPVQLTDFRHLIYFITYIAGALAFYSLAKRWLNEVAALGTTLLFVTQPILWGHAFMNPKDTPFMALFLLSLAFGFKMIDSIQATSFDSLTSSAKRTLAILTALWLVSVFSLFIFTHAFYDYISSLVLSAQAGNMNIISLVAKNISGVDSNLYIQRYFILFLQIRFYYFLLSTLLLLFLWYRLQPVLLKAFFAVLPAGILLGLTTSTRILGPFAGLIITYFALRTKGKQALPAIGIYAVIALIFTYYSWPYLWMDPVIRFFESFKEMSLYPWTGRILFNGISYQSTNLPYAYLPVLFAIQLTEPVWALAIVGWVAAIIGVEKKRELIELSMLWFAIPLILFIILRTALYDNFRQILFILPPIFLMAGVVFEKIKNVKLQLVLIVLCLIPSLAGIISLHPYEYIYYNRFVGGVNGADKRFDMDYWVISYREAAEYVNSVASPNAAIWVEGPSHLFATFAREDLKVYSPHEVERAESYEYIVSTTRYDLDKLNFPNANIVYRIERDEVLLTVIKQP
jgi:hypothetical protein